MTVQSIYDDVRQSFLNSSRRLRISSPLFSTLAGSCAGDQGILDIALAARPGQSRGLFTLLAAQYLLFDAPGHPAARYFPSVALTPESPNEAFPYFREFCLSRRTDLKELLATRTINANLVERASCILPALMHVAQLAQAPLTLVEFGCSAGFNLLFDKYHYDYETNQLGPPNSPVQLSCRSIGASLPVDAFPPLAERFGVDLLLMDPSSESDKKWLQAMLCPEWHQERSRLSAALTIRRQHQLKIVKGNALDALPDILTRAAGVPCLLHTYSLNQWSKNDIGELNELIRDASLHHPIHRIGIDLFEQEPPDAIRGRLAKLAKAGFSLRQKSLASHVEHIEYRDGHIRVQQLGQADAFGAWLDWSPTKSPVSLFSGSWCASTIVL